MSDSDVLKLEDYLGNGIIADFYKAYAKAHSLEPELYMPPTIYDIGRVLKMIQRAGEIKDASDNRLYINVRIGGGELSRDEYSGKLYPFRACDVPRTREMNVNYGLGYLESQSELYSREKHGRADEIYIWDEKTSFHTVVNILKADDFYYSLVARDYGLFLGFRAYYDQIGYIADALMFYDEEFATALMGEGGKT